MFNQHLSSVAVDQADFNRQPKRHLEGVERVEETKERLAAPNIAHLFDRSSVGQVLVDNASVIIENGAISARTIHSAATLIHWSDRRHSKQRRLFSWDIHLNL